GGLVHYWRNNDDPSLRWLKAGTFGAGLGRIDAVALIHGTLGQPPGNLEAIVRAGNQLFSFYRDTAWNGPISIPITGADGYPAAPPRFCLATFGAHGAPHPVPASPPPPFGPPPPGRPPAAAPRPRHRRPKHAREPRHTVRARAGGT